MRSYHAYYFGGMHYIWRFVWLALLCWIFLTPWSIPGERRKKDSPLYILQMRFASGEITRQEYSEQKRILETN